MNSRNKVVFCLHLGQCHYKKTKSLGDLWRKALQKKNVKGVKIECMGYSTQ